MPIDTLYDSTVPRESRRLTDALHAAYDGDVLLEESVGRPMVFGNFVQTLDGIVSLKIPGRSGGADISGHNEEDAFIMGLLRAYADAVMIGEETFRNGAGHLWTAGFVCPRFEKEFAALHARLGKQALHPVNVVVSGRGHVDLQEALFREPAIRSLVFTTAEGATRLRERFGTPLPATVHVLPGRGTIGPAEMLALLYERYGVRLLLHEGGPTLFSSFLAAGFLDELFLTVAPQIVGPGRAGERPAFSGPLSFTPEEAVWGRLLSVKRSTESGHLFLRYRFR